MSNTRRFSNGASAVLSRSSSVELQFSGVGRALDPHWLVWNVTQQALLACVCYELLIVPYLITFRRHVTREDPVPVQLLLLYACEVLFALDFFINTTQSCHERKHRNLTDANKACKVFARSPMFWLDLFVLMPLSLLPFPGIPVALLEVHKLLRVVKVRRYVSIIDDMYAKHFVTLKLLKMLAMTVILSHVVACARFSFGYREHSEDEWLPERPANATDRTQYLMSLFWAFGLLTGLFEGELPRTIGQFIFTITVALFGFLLFTYLCATFFMISRSEAGYSSAADARITQFRHLLAFHRVPDALQEQAIEYLKNYYTHADANDREAEHVLCPSITKDIQVELLKETIARIPFFLGCNEQFIIAITSLLEMVSLPANAVVFEIGELGDSMYIVNSGVLHVLVGGTKVKEVRKASYFGEMAIFLNRPRSGTVVTATYCTLYKLLRTNVERVLEGYPQYAKSIPKKIEVLAKGFVGVTTRKTLTRVPSMSESSNDEPRALATTKNVVNVLRASLAKSRARVPVDSESGDLIADSPPARRASLQSIASERRLSAAHVHSSQTSDNDTTVRHFVERLLCSLRRIRAKFAPQRPLWSYFLLEHAVDPESMLRMWWILALQLALLYNWTVVPLQLAFDLLDTQSWAVTILNGLGDMVLWIDVYLNFSLGYLEDSEWITDTGRTAIRYIRGCLLVDLACVVPYELLVTASVHHALTRLPRLFRIWRVWGHYHEVDSFFRLSDKQRLFLFVLLLVMLYHVTACLYFSVTYLEGFGGGEASKGHHNAHEVTDTWLPSADVSLRRFNSSTFVDANGVFIDVSDESVSAVAAKQYFRSLYFAAYILTALGRTVEPATNTQYAIALAFMLSGFVITAVVVDNVQKRYTASAQEQKEFLATRLKIQLFLRRQNAPLSIHKRVNSFLDFWWFAHRGAVIGEILNELPQSIKREVMHSICNPALQTLALLQDVRPVLDQLEDAFLNHVQFILYGQSEVVYRRGDYATGLFFLLEGIVSLQGSTEVDREVPPGGFFGTVCLMDDESQFCYVDRATATTGCIVLFLAKENLPAVNKHFPPFPTALISLEQRLLGSKMAKASTRRPSQMAQWISSDLRRGSGLLQQMRRLKDEAIDPDSFYVVLWEFLMFAGVSVQSVRLVFELCFGVEPSEVLQVDATTVCIEVLFVVDMIIRTRLGFYRFGNKVMELRLIWRRYVYSTEFLVDLVAVLPIFAYNWTAASSHRTEFVNVNKFVRLVKVPQRFKSLEDKFLKFTMELRLAKLVYYTFMLSHFFGCFWFNFASRRATNSLPTAFGANDWLPPAELENATMSLKYASSLFWAFGLMSASSPGELPKSVWQCVFSVMTMTTGFFLFAYVVGNFGDVIELNDAENRAFYAKLSSLRHFLAHFNVAKPLAHNFKMYFFLRRFHSITQEHLLARCLPPSLLTDIRMVHLQPMILRVSFLSGMDASVTHLLVSQFTQVLLARDEYVYRMGDEGSDMYFVFTGLLHSLLPPDELAREVSMLDRRTSFSHAFPTMFDEQTEGSNKPKRVLNEDNLKKVGEIRAGSYFGENALLSNSTRSAHVQAKSSCILYTLSRDSLELVFERYPEWKQKVLRSMKIHQERQKLNRLEREEIKPRHGNGKRTLAAKLDILNAMAERTEADVLQFLRPQRSLFRRRTSSQEMLTRGFTSRGGRERTESKLARLRPALASLLHGAAAQSPLHIRWIKLVICATLYVAIIVPYRIAFERLDVHGWWSAIVRELEVVCDAIFILDVLVNFRLQESLDSMELYEQDHRVAYKKERMVTDVLAFFPIDYLVSSIGTVGKSPWFRANRCLKLLHFMHYSSEINRDSISIELHRLTASSAIYFIMIYWVACSYFSISTSDGFSDKWDSWVPMASLDLNSTTDSSGERRALRLLRGLFFATTALVKKGRTFPPSTQVHIYFSVIICFFGLLLMAFMIGEIAGLLISYISHEVEYRKNHIAVEMYLSRWKISGDLRLRAHRYLSSLWASHRGVDYQQLLEDLPKSIRTEAILKIANWSLSAFMEDVLRPFHPVHSVDLGFPILQTIAQLLKFEGYSRHENVLVEGSISKAMYFVVRGHLCAVSSLHANAYRGTYFKGGDYFGEKGLLGYSISACSVRTLRSCDLLSLSASSLLQAMRSDNVSSLALSLADEAVQTMRRQDPLSDKAAMEERWGNTLLNAIKLRLLECSLDDVGVSFASQRIKGIIVARFDVDTPAQAFQLFRPLLQLMVPHGSLLNYGSAAAFGGKKPVVEPDWSFKNRMSLLDIEVLPSGSSVRSENPGFSMSLGSSLLSERGNKFD
ncbi:TPA: hypothetical protein N0F65_001056 [Lagenidium giganteum]|uniref:Cyclic nucleotide-binding domain-containing protein n=1 Tax=Lagenidium giganteum TaxID=4803 RepID=A0AAV2YPY7_9STRA|nr:TPA: hypothetical protein N0F65_001056 [Lagenidium giganteum]